MRRFLLRFIFLIFCFPLMAKTFVFTPQWTAQSQFAGYYVALEKGFYKEVGLDIRIVHPSASDPNLHRLLRGEADIITLQLITAMIARDSGLPLVNILQTSQNNSLVLVSRTPIHSLQDLRKKKLGYWKAGFHELAIILDKKNQLDIEWIPFIQNVNLYISGAIDATLAKSYNELYQLKYSGLPLNKENIVFFSDIGYNLPEDGLYVTQKFYEQHKNELEQFTKATMQAWQWAAEHPEESLEIVMNQVRKNKIGTHKEQQRWMLHEILKLQINKSDNTRSFRVSPESFQFANEILLQHGLIKKTISYQEFIKP